MFKFFENEERQQMFWGYIFIFPALLFFLIMSVYPLFYSFFLSFHNWNILNPHKEFIFFENYIELFSDTGFMRSIFNTFCYAAIIVPVGLALSTFFAVLLNSGIRFVGLFRFMFFVPVITSSIAAVYIWKWLYDPSFGLFNYIFSFFNIQVPFLASPYTSLLSICAICIWRNMGVQIVILLTGLTSIPSSIYEAAEMDGVTGWKRFRYITLPLLKPTLTFLSVTGVMGAFQLFGEIFIASPTGGPLNSTRSMVFDIQQTAFTSYKMGYSSAMTFVLFAIIMAFTIFQMKFLSDKK